MFRFVFALCLVTLSSASPPQIISSHKNWPLLDCRQVCGRSAAGRQRTPRIANGHDAKEHEFPWMAQIIMHYHNHRYPWCGGSLISKRYVLTAAHCVTDGTKNAMKARDFLVRLGAHRILDGCANDVGCREVPVQEIVVHGGYQIQRITHDSITRVQNDIALLRLDEDVIFSGSISPVCLPVDDTMIFDRFQLRQVVIAYGSKYTMSYTQYEYPEVLQKMRTQVANGQYDCVFDIGWDGTAKQICTRAVKGKVKDYGAAVCSGDSGSPLMYRDRNDGFYYQIGIVSYVSEKCERRHNFNQYAVIHTRVSPFLDWILENIRA